MEKHSRLILPITRETDEDKYSLICDYTTFVVKKDHDHYLYDRPKIIVSSDRFNSPINQTT